MEWYFLPEPGQDQPRTVSSEWRDFVDWPEWESFGLGSESYTFLHRAGQSREPASSDSFYHREEETTRLPMYHTPLHPRDAELW